MFLCNTAGTFERFILITDNICTSQRMEDNVSAVKNEEENCILLKILLSLQTAATLSRGLSGVTVEWGGRSNA